MRGCAPSSSNPKHPVQAVLYAAHLVHVLHVELQAAAAPGVGAGEGAVAVPLRAAGADAQAAGQAVRQRIMDSLHDVIGGPAQR